MAGPLAFAAATAAGARRMPAYRSRDEAISALACRGSPGASVMVAGFLALGLGTLDLARSIPTPERTSPAVRCMLAVAGVTTIGAGLARCSSRSCPSRLLGDAGATMSDELHGVFSMATFLLWIAAPAVSARAASSVDKTYASRARVLAGATFAAWVTTGVLVSRRSERWGGLAQRAMAAFALAWFPLVAAS